MNSTTSFLRTAGARLTGLVALLALLFLIYYSPQPSSSVELCVRLVLLVVGIHYYRGWVRRRQLGRTHPAWYVRALQLLIHVVVVLALAAVLLATPFLF